MRILVVDNQDDFRRSVVRTLQERGFEVMTASDGTEAMGRIQSEGIDLLMLDLEIPGMDGLTLLRRLRRDPRYSRLSAMVVSDVRSRSVIADAGRLGVRDYLLKSSFSVDGMLRRLTRYDRPSGGGDGCEGSAAARTRLQAASEADDEPTRNLDEVRHQVHAAARAEQAAAEALKTIKPIITRSAIHEHIEQCGELKAMSPTIGQLLKMTTSGDCSIDRVAQVIKQDQALSLKVLKLANSPVYSRGEPVETVQNAVMRIGLTQIRQAALNIAVIDQFCDESISNWLHVPSLWEHCIATGLIAGEITRRRGGKESEVDSAFTMGLLHDVGRIILAERLGEQYAHVLRTAEELALPLEQVETRMLLVNHADLMDKAMHAWKFPKHLINPIALHHLSMANIRKYAPRMVAEVSTLALANRLAHAMLLGDSGNPTIYPTDDFITALKLNGDDIREIEQTIPSQTDDLRIAMLTRAHDAAWQTRMTRPQIDVPLRPLFAAANGELDAYRIVTERLAAPPSETEKPNLMIVHLTDVRHRAALTASVVEQEAAAGVSKLPTIIISSKGHLALEESAMVNRPSRMIASPLTLCRLVDAIRMLLAHAAHPRDIAA